MLSVRCPVCNVGVLWPNGWTDQDETWHAGRPRPWPHYVRWRPSSLSPKGAQPSPQFSAHICFGHTGSRCHLTSAQVTVLDGDPAPPTQKGGGAPKFSTHVYSGQTAGWMKLVLGMEVGLSPGDCVLDADPVPFTQKGAEPFPQFSAHFYCGKRLHASKCHLVWMYASAQGTLC